MLTLDRFNTGKWATHTGEHWCINNAGWGSRSGGMDQAEQDYIRAHMPVVDLDSGPSVALFFNAMDDFRVPPVADNIPAFLTHLASLGFTVTYPKGE